MLSLLEPDRSEVDHVLTDDTSLLLSIVHKSGHSLLACSRFELAMIILVGIQLFHPPHFDSEL